MLIGMGFVAGTGSVLHGSLGRTTGNEAVPRVFLFGPGTRRGVSSPGTSGIWRCTTVGQKCSFVSWQISLEKLKHRIPLPQYFGVLFETQLGGPVPGSTTGLGTACTVGWRIFIHRSLAKGTKVQDLPTDFEGTANQILGLDTHIFAFADRPIVFGFRFGNPVQKSDCGAVGRHGGDTGFF